MKVISLFGAFVVFGVSALSENNDLPNLENEPFLRDMIQDLEIVHGEMNFTSPGEEPLLEPGNEVEETFSATANLSPEEKTLVQRMVRFSGAAYCMDLTLKPWACKHCRKLNKVQLVSIETDVVTGGRGFIALDHSAKQIVVSFRGSSNIRNWLTNFNMARVEFDVGDGTKDISVHKGFLQYSNAITQKMIPTIRALYETYHYEVTTTGHSLGAAVATISSITIKNQINIPWSKVNLVTFGEPRVGNSKFATWVNRNNPNHIRVVNNRDMVAHVPTKIQGYLHRKREIFLLKKVMRSCTHPDMEDPSCSLSRMPLLSILDHIFYLDTVFGLVC